MESHPLLVILHDEPTRDLIARSLQTSSHFYPIMTTSWQEAKNLLMRHPPQAILLGVPLPEADIYSIKEDLSHLAPLSPVILLCLEQPTISPLEALRLDFFDLLQTPLKIQELSASLERAIKASKRQQEYARMVSARDTASLKEQVDLLETIHRIGRELTHSLDIDKVLSAVVEASVTLTNAEEGNLMLLDEPGGELYVRAQKNFQEEFARTFRLPVEDSLAGEVLRSGKPLILDREAPHKIKTSFMVYNLIYVPITIQGKAIGVLSVDNRQSQRPFLESHLALLSTLADYAAIAIENARLYTHVRQEQQKLHTLLENIIDGVLVVDHEQRVMMINLQAREALSLTQEQVLGKTAREVLPCKELVDLIEQTPTSLNPKIEFQVENGRIYRATATPIPEIGTAITMQEITQQKELDRIKSEFVSAVSHDLRSPLTAILGYVELLDRIGPLNDQQREFVQRIKNSVHNITALINDLLDLGRIEAGFDLEKERIPLSLVIHYVLDGIDQRIEKKKINLITDVPENLPYVLGNPLRLRQMLLNLIDNAIKYTPEGGEIRLLARAEKEQVVLQVADTGVGIPVAEQSFIFDKFYRASNVAASTTGTGLGLAIVKSIVENHQGRIWLDSAPGKGTVFTIMLPQADIVPHEKREGAH